MDLPLTSRHLTWVNEITTRQVANQFAIQWSLLGGDLEHNEGRMTVAPFTPPIPTVDYAGPQSLVRYNVRISASGMVRASAQNMVTRWLLPVLIQRLRGTLETT